MRTVIISVGVWSLVARSLIVQTSASAIGISVKQLGDANREAVSAIHALAVQVENKSEPPGVEYTYTWTWSGEHQRCLVRFSNRSPVVGEFSKRKFPIGITDAYNGPKDYRALMNKEEYQSWDASRKQEYMAAKSDGLARNRGTLWWAFAGAQFTVIAVLGIWLIVRIRRGRKPLG